MSVLYKQPSETKRLYIEFSEYLATGDSLASITSITESTGDISIFGETISGTKVQASYSGGVDGTLYSIVAIVVTTVGETLEVDLYLRVLDTSATTVLASYFSLLERVGHQIYGIRSGFTADQTADIENAIVDGLRRVYAAHNWSFFRPVKTITTVDGTATYSLPAACESVESEMHYAIGESDYYPPVRERHDSEIRKRQQDDDEEGRPLYFSVRTVEFDPTTGSQRQLVLYPTPDDEYVLYAKMTLRATMVDETNLYPVGAEQLSQLITEACLASAEHNFDDAEGVHSKLYLEMLPFAIQADMEAASPRSLGPDSPRGERAGNISRSAIMGDVSIDGVTM